MPAKTPKVLLLETQLDEAFDSHRSQAAFMREFFRNLPELEFVSKEVHSRADLEKFLDYAREDGSVKALHLIAHGTDLAQHSSIVLTRAEEIDLADRKNVRLFRDLGCEVLLFSCCSLGRNPELLGSLLDSSQADVVFSYSADVRDNQAFVIEPLLYQLAYGTYRGTRSKLGWFEIYERLLFVSEVLGLDENRSALSDPLLVASFRQSVPDARKPRARNHRE
jgi:hypothetical protein